MSSRSANSYVLFPIGGKRYALPAFEVTELARPDRLQSFPHTTPLLTGVLVRRGRIIPVCDVASVLVGPYAPECKFYLITSLCFCGLEEWTAIPVTGECELVASQAAPPRSSSPDYVAGLLTRAGVTVEIIDLEKVISQGARA